MPSPTSVPEHSQLTVLYDEDCRFCRWSVAKLISLDGAAHLRPEPIQSELGQQLLAAIPTAERLASAHCVDTAGQVSSGGDAFSLVAAQIPGLGFASRVASAVPIVPQVGYRLVAGNRGSFGRFMTTERLAAADLAIAARRKQP